MWRTIWNEALVLHKSTSYLLCFRGGLFLHVFLDNKFFKKIYIYYWNCKWLLDWFYFLDKFFFMIWKLIFVFFPSVLFRTNNSFSIIVFLGVIIILFFINWFFLVSSPLQFLCGFLSYCWSLFSLVLTKLYFIYFYLLK